MGCLLQLLKTAQIFRSQSPESRSGSWMRSANAGQVATDDATWSETDHISSVQSLSLNEATNSRTISIVVLLNGGTAASDGGVKGAYATSVYPWRHPDGQLHCHWQDASSRAHRSLFVPSLLSSNILSSYFRVQYFFFSRFFCGWLLSTAIFIDHLTLSNSFFYSYERSL